MSFARELPFSKKSGIFFPQKRPSRFFHGDYGEEVITAGCGPVIEGSIPSSHPTSIPAPYGAGVFVLVKMFLGAPGQR